MRAVLLEQSGTIRISGTKPRPAGISGAARESCVLQHTLGPTCRARQPSHTSHSAAGHTRLGSLHTASLTDRVQVGKHLNLRSNVERSPAAAASAILLLFEILFLLNASTTHDVSRTTECQARVFNLQHKIGSCTLCPGLKGVGAAHDRLQSERVTSGVMADGEQKPNVKAEGDAPGTIQLVVKDQNGQRPRRTKAQFPDLPDCASLVGETFLTLG